MPLFLRLLRLFACLIGCAVLPLGALAASTVVIVSSERSPAYVEATEALVRELERNGLSRYEMLQLSSSEWMDAGPITPKVIVTFGTEAAEVVAKTEPRAPVLCTLLPRSSFERVIQVSGRKPSPQFSALYLDQPLSRQLELIRLTLPTARRIGVLWGADAQAQGQTGPINALARARGLELVEGTVGRNETIFPALKRILEDSDLLLAMPDPQLFNSNSIQNILLASFRARVPMVAFSPAYVRAGALVAVHVTPTQIGLQAAAIAQGVLQGKTLSGTPLYSRDFSVSVNEHVAHSLGLTLDARDLNTRLHQREAAP